MAGPSQHLLTSPHIEGLFLHSLVTFDTFRDLIARVALRKSVLRLPE